MVFGISGNFSVTMDRFDPQVGGMDVSHLLRRARAIPMAPSEKKKLHQLTKKVEDEEEQKTRPGTDLRKMYAN